MMQIGSRNFTTALRLIESFSIATHSLEVAYFMYKTEAISVNLILKNVLWKVI
jgi:hypothetical protein